MDTAAEEQLDQETTSTETETPDFTPPEPSNFEDDPSFSPEEEDDASAAARKAFFSDDVPDSHLGAEKEAAGEKQEETEQEPSDDTPQKLLDVEYSLDDVRVPQKYKEEVAKKIDSILGDANAKSLELTEGLRGANNAVLQSLVDVMTADDPMGVLRGYAEKLAPHIGLTEESLKNLKGNTDAAKGPESNAASVDPGQAFDMNAVQAAMNKKLAEIEDRYWPLLEREEDALRARQIFSKMDQEKSELRTKVNMALMAMQQKSQLQSFYDQSLKPQFDKFGKVVASNEEATAVAARGTRVSLWNEADAALDKQYSKEKGDYAKYRPKIKELLKTRYKTSTGEANTNGKGHLELMRDLYLIVSRKDHIESARKPKFGRQGVRPQGTKVKTEKAGGMSEQEIKERYWSDLIPPEDMAPAY